MEAISNAGSCVGILAKDGVVLAAEKRITSKVRPGWCSASQPPRTAGRHAPPCQCLLWSAAWTALRQHEDGSMRTWWCIPRVCVPPSRPPQLPGCACLPARLQLLDSQAVGVRREKMYRLDDHIACAVGAMCRSV